MIQTALWLDAADASTVTTVSGAVSQWNDKSGNRRNATQGTAANRPAYTFAGQNGQNVLTFDGTNDSLNLTADLDIKPAHSVFIAAENNATITDALSAQLLLSGTGYTYPSTTTSEFLLGVGSLTGNLNNERLYSVAVANGVGAADVYGYGKTNADVSGGFFLSSAFTTSGNAFTGRLNGSSDFATTGSAGGYSSLNIRYPSTIRGIGYRFSNSLNYWNGQIREIIVCQSSLAIADINKVEGYLAHKWGLTSNLPSDHPYKTVGPTP